MDGKIMWFNRSIIYNAVIFLLIMAVLDSLFTDFGIRNNYISEANPLMRFLYESSVPGFYIIKISLPLLLMYIITKINHLKKYFQILIWVTLLLYVFVLFQHIFWISLVVRGQIQLDEMQNAILQKFSLWNSIFYRRLAILTFIYL